MSLLIEIKGITRLSELEIDADKDWQGRGIINLKQLAALMSKGDIVVRGDSVLVRLPAGPDGYVLTSAGPGKMPSWQPAGGALKYYFPVDIGAAQSGAKVIVAQLALETGPVVTDKKYAYGDSPDDFIRRLEGLISTAKDTSVATVNQSYNKNMPVGRDISTVVDGAVSETAGGIQTDETAAARNEAANDLNLCPMTPAVEDKYYLGFSRKFRRLWINVGTGGAGNWANQIEYWNGSAWVSVSNEDDQTSDFTMSGVSRMDWDMPADWVQTTIMGMTLYWIRIRTVSFVNQTTAPRGTQAWACLVT